MSEVEGALQPSHPTPTGEILRIGSFEVDVRAGELRRAGLKIKLQGQPFDVLVALLEKPGQVVTREELHDKLWSQDTFVDFEHGLNRAINKVREALGDDADNPRFVETLPRRGYRFLVPVTVPTPDRASKLDQAGAQRRPQPSREIKPTAVPATGITATQDPLVGKTLGHYQIAEKIGSGGMGNVYRAHDQHLDREVAIKVLSPGTLADEHARKRFRREALALSKLNHPNIATAHDFDTEEGLDFLVLEYIPGVTLSVKLAARAMTETEVIALGAQLAEGLSAAHERGVVHGDLKPANLLVIADERIKILDFGLARLRGPVMSDATTQSLTEAHPWGGTLSYMAPEQLLGGEIDARTDIYSAGCVLYEMAIGQQPFADVDRSQLIGAILRAWQPFHCKAGLSPELKRIISKCLEKAPEARYQSAKELATDLRRPSARQFLVPDDTVRRRARAPMRKALRRSILALGAATLVLAVITGFMWIYRRSVRPSSTPSIAVLPFADLSPGHDEEYFSDGLAEEILNDLAKIPTLKVVARTSAFEFKGKNEDLRDIARKLNVENVLEGSVRREGRRVRVSAQLVSAHDGFHLWSESYDRDLKDVLTVQDDIAEAVSSALQLKLLAAVQSAAAVSASRTVNVEAYQYFLQARYFGQIGNPESQSKAVEYINKAIQSDPRYAAAYAWRADRMLVSGGMAWINYPKAIQNARADIKEALALDPNLADGYRVLSMIQSLVESNCVAAETTLKKAEELSPGSADNRGERGLIARCLGRQNEAVVLTQEALALDPLQPGRYLILAQNLRDLGRYEEAQAALGRALDLDPQAVWIHETRGELYLAQGQPKMALDEMQKEPAGFLQLLGLALAYHALGRHQESDTALADLISHFSNDCAYQIAEVYAYREEVDQAFKWLARAYTQHDGGLILLRTDLLLRAIRSDSRYLQMLRTLNLPVEDHDD